MPDRLDMVYLAATYDYNIDLRLMDILPFTVALM
jgi:hypothetical protein